MILAWFTFDFHGKRKKSSKGKAGIWCAHCGAKYDNSSSGCVVSVQRDTGSRGGKVFRAFSPKPGLVPT